MQYPTGGEDWAALVDMLLNNLAEALGDDHFDAEVFVAKTRERFPADVLNALGCMSLDTWVEVIDQSFPEDHILRSDRGAVIGAIHFLLDPEESKRQQAFTDRLASVSAIKNYQVHIPGAAHRHPMVGPPTACCARFTAPLPLWCRLLSAFSLYFIRRMTRDQLRTVARGDATNNWAGRVIAVFMPEHWQWLSTTRLRWAVRRAIMLMIRQAMINTWWSKRP
jgi:hypothetical protein